MSAAYDRMVARFERARARLVAVRRKTGTKGEGTPADVFYHGWERAKGKAFVAEHGRVGGAAIEWTRPPTGSR